MEGGWYLSAVLVVSLSLGTALELHDIARESAAKAVAYSDDMNAALDCAYTARPLDECSPNLFSTEFKTEAERTRAIIDDLRAQQPGTRLERH
jgi:hypothetical protein